MHKQSNFVFVFTPPPPPLAHQNMSPPLLCKQKYTSNPPPLGKYSGYVYVIHVVYLVLKLDKKKSMGSGASIMMSLKAMQRLTVFLNRLHEVGYT